MDEQISSYDPAEASALPPVRELTKGQRRVLGVLVEKAITTPDQYPLTLKALTAGCNQKSNRDPVTSYSEEAVEEYVGELRVLGLVACVHTESGRTERFRHYVRKRFPFNEPQLAVITELWLRGRQQLGELRSRASRMASIETQEDLRAALQGLMEQGYAQVSGPLERRGVEVDHSFYPATEETRQEPPAVENDVEDRADEASSPPTRGRDDGGRLAALETSQRELLSEIATLKEQVSELSDVVAELRRSLGV
jgi:hypothetical protein